MKQLAIGLDIGGTRTKLGLVDLERGVVLESLIFATEKRDSHQFLGNIFAAIDQLKLRADVQRSPILGVGFGVTGFVFADGKVDSTYGFLEFMEDYPLAKYIGAHSGLACRGDNDARVVALGEALYGIGKGQARILVLTLGTGLGLGFIADGHFETALPYSHMGGHLSIGHTDFVCYCGKRGCLESLVSASALVDAAARLGWIEKYPAIPLTVEGIFQAEQAGNPDAERIVSDFLRYLKMGIDNYVNIYAPNLIILGGGVSKGMQPYLERLIQIEFLAPYKRYQVKIALSELDELSGILGSAALFHA